MSKRQLLIWAVVLAALCLLVWLQFRHWQDFQWGIFWEQTRNASPLRMLSAIFFVYLAYYLRALRWRIFLKPVRRTTAWRLLPSMLIGFTGLAILGRPGEFIRPYLVAKREDLPVSSQLAVWTVERIFDMGAFAALMAYNLVAAPSLRALPYFDQFRKAGLLLLIFVVAMALFAFALWKNTDAVASLFERILKPLSARFAAAICSKVTAFGRGLHTVHDLPSLLQLIGLSLAVWIVIGFAYLEITHAYPEPLQHMTLSHVVLLMGFSIAGSTVQLPIVGGGSQLLTIGALAHVFAIPNELAVSCGILLWIINFVSVVPVGLFLAHQGHLSLTNLSKASGEAESAFEHKT